MKTIPITKLRGHEAAKPRKALVQSIRDQGLLPAFPIVVAPIKDAPDNIGGNSFDSYQILDGRRRTAASLQAGLDTVLAVVTEGDAALTILAHATRSENLVAELQAYQELQRANAEPVLLLLFCARPYGSILPHCRLPPHWKLWGF